MFMVPIEFLRSLWRLSSQRLSVQAFSHAQNVFFGAAARFSGPSQPVEPEATTLHLCGWLLSFNFHSSAGPGGQAQAVYCLKNGPEQRSRNRHLCHLKDNLPGMTHHLGSDLDQLLPQRR